MKVSLSADELCIRHFVIVVCIAVIAERTHKAQVEYRNEILIDIEILIHPTQQLGEALILDTDRFVGLDDLPGFSGIRLEIIVGNGFGKIEGKDRMFFRGGIDVIQDEFERFWRDDPFFHLLPVHPVEIDLQFVV